MDVLNRNHLWPYLQDQLSDPGGELRARKIVNEMLDDHTDKIPMTSIEAAVFGRNLGRSFGGAHFSERISTRTDLPEIFAQLTGEHLDMTPQQIFEHFFVAAAIEVYEMARRTLEREVGRWFDEGGQ